MAEKKIKTNTYAEAMVVVRSLAQINNLKSVEIVRWTNEWCVKYSQYGHAFLERNTSNEV